ncbi:MAG TPA: HAMP domain-containing sensor histidine kinase [Solirubrobacteraceae bacterium]
MGRLAAALPAGLRWRLTAWVAGVMIVSAAAVFVVVYKDTGTQLRSQIDRNITADTHELAQALRPYRGASPAAISAAATRYMRAQPYTASSTLLFVLAGGAATVSNHPEVFGGSAPEAGETTAEQSREDREGRGLATPRLGYSTPHVPDVGRMRVLERPLDLGTVRVVTGAGEPLVLAENAQHDVAKAFLVAGAVVLVLALIASYLAGARVSAPLRRMAAVAARVDGGDLAPRMEVARSRRDEVTALADSFNRMLDRLAEAFSSQREFIADASHELRTPLTVIRGQLEVMAAQEHPTENEVRRVERLVQAEITRLSRMVDDLLILTQAEHVDFLRPEQIDVPEFVEELWDGLSLTAERHFEVGTVPDGVLRADPDRLAQALRNLARNSIEHTPEPGGLVRLEVDALAGGRLRFSVIDDGPGIPPSERERIFERFHRVDAGRSRSMGGAGLGLSIVEAIADAHGGDVRAAEPLEGVGARVELVVPRFRRR